MFEGHSNIEAIGQGEAGDCLIDPGEAGSKILEK